MRAARRARGALARPPTGTSCAAGDFSFQPGASHACGDRNPVTGGVECPRPVRTAPGRAECPRPCNAGRGLRADPPPMRETLGVWDRLVGGIGIRRRTVPRQSSKAGPMSKSAAKEPIHLSPLQQNRGIMRFYVANLSSFTPFAADLDTCSHRSATLVATPTPATRPACRSNVTPPWARTRPARVATVRTGLRH